MTPAPRPVGRPAKAGRHYRVRLTDEQHAAVLARAAREGISNLSDAIAIAAEQWANQSEDK